MPHVLLARGQQPTLCFLILPLLGIIVRVVYVYAREEVQNAEETDHYNR